MAFEEIERNLGNAKTVEHTQDVRTGDTATFRAIVGHQDETKPYFEITAQGLYVTVRLPGVSNAEALVRWAEPYARKGHGEINPPEWGTETEVRFVSGILEAGTSQTGHTIYSAANPPPLYPPMLQNPIGARLVQHGAHGNIFMQDSKFNQDEVVLGHSSLHHMGSRSVTFEGPNLTAADEKLAEAREADVEGTNALYGARRFA